ncbi:hypothetical protein [Microcoleus sp. K5-D4]
MPTLVTYFYLKRDRVHAGEFAESRLLYSISLWKLLTERSQDDFLFI